MTRVLLIAAYASVRAGLHALLEAAPGVAIVGEAAHPAQAVSLLGEARPDVAVLEWPDEQPEVLALAEALEERGAALVLMGEAPREAARELLERPLRGLAWLAREAEAAEIAGAVRAAAGGLLAFDRAHLAQILAPSSGAESQTAAPRDGNGAAVLSPREVEVLQLLASGLPNKSIARRLGISAHTVKFHVASILSKLGAASRTEAVAIGARGGLILL